MYDGVVFAHGFFDWVTVAPLGVRTGAVRPVLCANLDTGLLSAEHFFLFWVGRCGFRLCRVQGVRELWFFYSIYV